MSDKGNGHITLHPQARIVLLVKCPRCQKLEHSCLCGRPFKRPTA